MFLKPWWHLYSFVPHICVYTLSDNIVIHHSWIYQQKKNIYNKHTLSFIDIAWYVSWYVFTLMSCSLSLAFTRLFSFYCDCERFLENNAFLNCLRNSWICCRYLFKYGYPFRDFGAKIFDGYTCVLIYAM